MSILVPLVFLIFGLFDERGVFNKSGFIKLIISISLVLISFYIIRLPISFSKLLSPIFSVDFYPLKPTSEISFYTIIFSFLVLSIRAFFVKSHISIALPFAMLCASYPFLFSIKPNLSPLLFGLSCAILGAMLVMEAYKMAFIDTLTRIPARRAMEEYISGLSHPYALCIVDIDHFKKFNDTYGHKTGDEVLRYIAKELQATKGGAKTFRYGGEEFCIIFAKKLSFEVKHFLEETRENIANKGFGIRAKKRPSNKKGEPQRNKKPNIKKVNLTVSMGLADSNASKNIYDIFQLADKALYKAKSAGRNRLKAHIMKN